MWSLPVLVRILTMTLDVRPKSWGNWRRQGPYYIFMLIPDTHIKMHIPTHTYMYARTWVHTNTYTCTPTHTHRDTSRPIHICTSEQRKCWNSTISLSFLHSQMLRNILTSVLLHTWTCECFHTLIKTLENVLVHKYKHYLHDTHEHNDTTFSLPLLRTSTQTKVQNTWFLLRWTSGFLDQK